MGLELYGGSVLCAFRGGEALFLLKTEEAGEEVHRKGAHHDVVGPYLLVVEFAPFVDAIFRAFELGLELAEIFGRLQVGIVFCHGEESTESLREFTLRLLESRHLFGCGLAGIDGYLRGLGAGSDHTFEGFAFVLGIALDGGDEVWDEVGAALIGALQVAPRAGDGFVLLHKAVVLRHRAAAQGEEEEDDSDETDLCTRKVHRDKSFEGLIGNKMRKKRLETAARTTAAERSTTERSTAETAATQTAATTGGTGQQ